MSNSEPVSSLKGIGEKTGKLFEKLGVITIDDLLSYYPRAYDTYEPPVPVGQLKEQMVMSVAAALPKPEPWMFGTFCVQERSRWSLPMFVI